MAKEHVWTRFELNTLLGLLCKGVHIPERGKRTDDPKKLQLKAYYEVASRLNTALNGERSYARDISKYEVVRKIEQLMDEKKGVVGQGGLMERVTRGKLTRSIKMAFLREPGKDYIGSISEWEGGRREMEMEKSRIRAAGGRPMVVLQEDELFVGSEEGPRQVLHQKGSQHGSDCERDNADWRDEEIAAFHRPDPTTSSTVNRDQAQQPRIQQITRATHDDFSRLPQTVRDQDKFAWRDTVKASEDRISRGARPMMDSYQPGYSQSRSNKASSPSRRSHDMEMDDDYRASTSSYHLASSPSLGPDSSSSPVKSSGYTGTSRPTTTRLTSSTAFEEAALEHTIEKQLTPIQKSTFKKPGLAKRRPLKKNDIIEARISGDRGDRTAEAGINPARRVMLAAENLSTFESEVIEIEAGFQRAYEASREGTNAEGLPFNRVERS